MSDFVIVGGGIMGMLLAKELSHAGAEITLIEKSLCGREASWAGGGIVSPLYPWRYSPAVTALASWAQSLYPALCAELLEITGIDPELEESGLLMLDAGDEEEALAWARNAGKTMQRLDARDIYRHQPGLAAGFNSALWMEDIANVRNPRLGKALRDFLGRLQGVTILEETEVLRMEFASAKLVSLRIKQGAQINTIKGRNYIVTAGAWSANLLASITEVAIKPIKGQMLLFNPGRKLLDSIVLTSGRYLIPRRDHQLLVGSTLEDKGFDKQESEEARQSLMQSAVAMLPALSDYPVVAQWAGLRPGTSTGIPYIGQCGSCENLFINAGHYRNGLVLAPASARLMADLLLGHTPLLDPQPYACSSPH
ncbi:MAG: glycine oxidase ThiO [Pseudomonadales bacterium]|nr:glycine oxidase ThiO [Pseudomonadales bacterium]